MTRQAFPAALTLGVLLTAPAARAADPTKQECVAANDAAQDLRQSGKLRLAREKLAVCAATSCPGVVRDDCTQRLAEVDSAMPHVVFAAKDAAGDDLGDVKVTIDGAPLADKLDGSSLKVDPGPHVFVFTWEGHPSVTKKLVLAEHDQARREVVAFGGAETPHVESAQAARPASDAPASQTETSHLPGPPLLSWVAFGVGGVGLAVGVIAGVTRWRQALDARGGVRQRRRDGDARRRAYVGDLDGFPHSSTNVVDGGLRRRRARRRGRRGALVHGAEGGQHDGGPPMARTRIGKGSPGVSRTMRRQSSRPARTGGGRTRGALPFLSDWTLAASSADGGSSDAPAGLAEGGGEGGPAGDAADASLATEEGGTEASTSDATLGDSPGPDGAADGPEDALDAALCIPQAVRCSNNGVQTCTSGGVWAAPVDCGNQACVSGVCVGVPAAPPAPPSAWAQGSRPVAALEPGARR